MVKTPLALACFLSLLISSALGQPHAPLVNAANGFSAGRHVTVDGYQSSQT